MLATMVLYKPNRNHVDEILEILPKIFKKDGILFTNDTLHFGVTFLVILSENTFKTQKGMDFPQMTLSKLTELLDSSKYVKKKKKKCFPINFIKALFREDDSFLCCLYIFFKKLQSKSLEILGFFSDLFPNPSEIHKKLLEDNYFFSQNPFLQVFISVYEEKNAFACYKNSLSQKTNACHQHFQNIIIKELLENEEIYDLNYENCFFSIFSLQTFPLSLNFIKLIEKYV